MDVKFTAAIICMDVKFAVAIICMDVTFAVPYGCKICIIKKSTVIGTYHLDVESTVPMETFSPWLFPTPKIEKYAFTHSHLASLFLPF